MHALLLPLTQHAGLTFEQLHSQAAFPKESAQQPATLQNNLIEVTNPAVCI